LEENKYYLGLDVGSTTVKGVLMKCVENSLQVIWKCYERHETRQAEKVLEYLKELEVLYSSILYPESPFVDIFITGSGGNMVKHFIGAHFYQEVSCVSSAVEKLYPTTKSVIELGGQDAKIILYKSDKTTGEKKKMMTMNDKCAGGTGAVIDKISSKLQLSKEDLAKIQYKNTRLHPVAGKCGVFAETDINGLQKQGICSDELMASLFEAIVQQNLSVLTRGNTLLPGVILLGGPNYFLPALQDAWKFNLFSIWRERGVNLTSFDGIDEMVTVPENGNYFAAIGAVYQGIKDKLTRKSLLYKGTGFLEEYISNREKVLVQGKSAFFKNESKQDFLNKYMPPEINFPVYHKGKKVKAVIGIDSGSTSTKGVLLSPEGEVIAMSYMLSKGNPIEDSKNILYNLRNDIEADGAVLEISAIGITGYGKDILKEVLQADVAVVETVAHTLAAKYYYPKVDVIVDVGGQDIKLIMLKDGIIKDFKLNTQCSAGNGYFLQNTAESFGYKVEDFAEIAFSAGKIAEFGYGCAVFLQTDIVDFQRQGWEGPEIMAGLAEVLPKNIWQYVAGISSLEMLGTTFVLQGGTQKNAAVVKSQVDYIQKKFKNSNKIPEIFVHKFTSVCGAIGAALEASSLVKRHPAFKTLFAGIDPVMSIQYESVHNETTRCNFCRNKCIRTFINITSSDLSRRLIIAPCEKGRFEETSDARRVQKEMNLLKEKNPNLIQLSTIKVWESAKDVVRGHIHYLQKMKWKHLFNKRNENILNTRRQTKLGFPRVLNHYILQPFFNAYFETLGFDYQNFYFSQYTNEEMYKNGSKRGAVDPCFPSKVSMSHVYDLIHRYGEILDYIIFPMIGSYPSGLNSVVDNKACPTITGAPEMVYAAMTKENDLFQKQGVKYLKPFLYMDEYGVLEKELYRQFSNEFKITSDENRVAVRAGYYALKKYKNQMATQGRKVMDMVINEKRVALVLLGRAYHNDSGLNHGIFDLFVERGYPVIPMSALPMDLKTLEQVFGDDENGLQNALNVDDVWKNSFSASSSSKIWAAKFIARCPNLIPVELSSFKCGHDSTLYSTIERIFEKASKPFFSFKDIDENNPSGSIKIRIETIDYFLKKYIAGLRGDNLSLIVNGEPAKKLVSARP
jgi:predicted CoA-substrate-specific enzyme activase